MHPSLELQFQQLSFSFVLGVVTEVVLACHLQNIRNLISLQHRELVMEDIKSQLSFQHNVIIITVKKNYTQSRMKLKNPRDYSIFTCTSAADDKFGL